MSVHGSLLVIGASGFLGAHVAAQARRRGLDVVTTFRGARPTQNSVAMDLCDPDSIDAAFAAIRPSVVINCAAYGVNYADQDANLAFHTNTRGPLHILDAAHRYESRCLIHVGSCFEYGSRDGLISEESPLNPTAVYGATKAAATILLRQRAQALAVPLLIARPFGLWGPGEPVQRIIPSVVKACLSRSPLKMTGCEVVRDYTYVVDLASWLLELSELQNVPSGTVLNMASGRGVVLKDFVSSIASTLGGTDLMLFGALPYRPTEMKSLVADVTRARGLLPMQEETPLHVGVERMVKELS